ncbi:unnamed protein product [Bursaphelenchus xylophilus]|uniref:(pine wood nematode) hypothetical protein n=1 Tax=Bursaphelenchus xylophilus TaxID=6326 RepID=A0A1I7S929_BURXY|nr:unnamed protein product [Bursaphelenchus xylophilus]CAG9086189.1 unnamed protein product [Bursaphelenchus xylophilus]
MTSFYEDLRSNPAIFSCYPFSDPMEKLVRIVLADGTILQTFAGVLMIEDGSKFSEMLKMPGLENKKFIRIDCSHRDASLMRYLIDFMRHLAYTGNPSTLSWPDEFEHWNSLISEAQYWGMVELEELFQQAQAERTNTITISYHAALSGGTGTDVNFRRIHRILVHGQVYICREVFGEHLNETRDVNVDYKRYTCRFYLSHGFLEQAFDTLALHRFRLVDSSSHTPSGSPYVPKQVLGSGAKSDNQFLHYAQYVFIRQY